MRILIVVKQLTTPHPTPLVHLVPGCLLNKPVYLFICEQKFLLGKPNWHIHRTSTYGKKISVSWIASFSGNVPLQQIGFTIVLSLQSSLSFSSHINILYEPTQLPLLQLVDRYIEIWATGSLLTHFWVSPAWVKKCVGRPTSSHWWHQGVILLPWFGVWRPTKLPHATTFHWTLA